MNPKVSVIVPIYGVEVFIRRCVESLCSQDYDNYELVFVDDGSPDSSVDILAEVLDAHPEVRAKSLIIRQKNAGLPKARMAGLGVATGDYVIHVDSDDWVEPDYLSQLVGKAVEEGADVVYCAGPNCLQRVTSTRCTPPPVLPRRVHTARRRPIPCAATCCRSGGCRP